MMRVADYIAEYVYNLGVKDVFMLSGGGMMFLSDGLAKHPKLKVICNHHEQASAMAAVAYAKYKNGIGVVYITTGCGGTNAVTGLLNAWQDSARVLFISGQVRKETTTRNSGLQLRQFGVQEVDIIPVVESLTKYAVMVSDPEKIAYHLDKAVCLAKSGRPGPVWIDVPLDVQGAVINEKKLERFKPVNISDHKIVPTHNELTALYDLISKAERPIVIAGQGIRLSDSNIVFQKIIEKYNLPVVATILGVGVIPTNHKLFIGRIGTKGDRAGNFSLQNSDLVIVLGSRLSVNSVGYDYKNFAREAKIVVIDIDAIEHQKKTVRIDLFINADLKNFFNIFKPNIFKNNDIWVKKCRLWKKKWPVCPPDYAKEARGVNLYYFVDQLSKLMKNDSIVVSDAGSSFYVVSQTISLKGKQRYVTSGGQAEMGYTIPACIGVSIAKNKQEVLGVTGDGSFQLNIQELQTIVYNKLPVKLFVWNNDGYLSIRATQRRFFDKRFIGTDKTSGVSFPDLKKIAHAYGIKYFKIRNSGETNGIIKKALKYKGAVICEVMCLRDQEIKPIVSSYKKDDGTMASKPMEDMYPFLDRKEFLSNMIIKPIKE